MVAMKLNILLFFHILYVTDCLRRIKDGVVVEMDKRYVVYLVKAPNSDKVYDEWLCGGALVSTLFIITSAACVTDVEFMYAIAGYRKYVPDEEIETDQCTKTMKKKVVYTCVPLKYELNYEKVEKWSFIDIALVKVESPYNLNDDTYNSLCSYIPTVIPVNYEPRFQTPGTDTLVYGWGHLEKWRKPDDTNFYNQDILRYAATKILDKPTCIKHYEMYNNMTEIIEQYMICALSQGEINDKGDLVLVGTSAPKADGCGSKRTNNNNLTQLKAEVVPPGSDGSNNECEDDYDLFQEVLIDNTRREDKKSNQTSSKSSQNRTVYNMTISHSRKYGICQNDHGGPLVTWVGGKEILIGVASVFKVSDDSKCMGPYLYTSTQCNGAFLDCILSNSNLPDVTGRRAICDSPPILRGYDTVERHISWKNHPSGSADNERDPPTTRIVNENEQLSQLNDLERFMRFALLAKTAKDQSAAVLRQSQRKET